MLDLPSLLLSYGINLKQRGNEYECLCFAHDDHNPSMSVYVNGTQKHVAHCFTCGFHEDVIGTYCHFNNLDPKNPEHFLIAKTSLESGARPEGAKFATISTTPKPPQPEREFLIPPDDNQSPRMDGLNDKHGTPMGEPQETWLFTTPDGKPWYYEARYIVNGKKEPRCWTYGKRGAKPARWACAFPSKPRPIFALDRIASTSGQVAVFEGARKAELAQTLVPSSIACTAWVGGANGWRRSDWMPVAGRVVLLFPDADDPGRTVMAELAQHLIGIGCTVHIVDDPASPDKWDICDREWTPEEFISWAKAHKSAKIEPLSIPDELPDDPADASMYSFPEEQAQPIPSPPLEAYRHGTTERVWTEEPTDLFSAFVVPPLANGLLPKVIEDHVFDLAEVINTDRAFGALTAVATVAGLLDDRIKIELNHGYRESARLWCMCVGEPSTKKSPIMDAVRHPLGAIKRRYAQEEAKIIQKQGVIDARHKAKLKEYTEACIKSDDHNIPEPTPPARLERRRIECDNLTREAFEVVLQDMPCGLIIHADEAAAFIGGMDAYKSAGVKADRALWLRAYNGGPMQIDKVTRGSYLIVNWSATITCGIQPSKLAAMAGQLDDDGLLQRFLIVSSGRDGGQGLSRSWDTIAAKAWTDLLNHIVETKPGGSPVTLSSEAATIRNEAVAYIYQIINSKMISRAFTTALGKWEGTTGRMLLIFHAVECAQQGVHPETVPVSGATAQLAIDYMLKHLLPHMVSFYEDGLGQSPAHDIAKLLAGRIVARGDTEITMRDLSQYGPHKWRLATEDIQRQALSRLIEGGWIEPVELANQVSRRPSRYHVNPHVHALFAKHRADEQAKIEAAREIGRRVRAGASG